MNRFIRTEMLLGSKAMKKLADAHVTVCGLGAVGSYAVEALARSGVGHLALIDFDEVRDSNINRQLYALTSTIGRFKSDLARQRVMDINPQCDLKTLRVFLDSKSAPAALTPRPHVVIDAIDSVGPKLGLLDSAVKAEVPCIISSMGAAQRTDPFSVRVADLSETENCPLARFMRKRLKKRGVTTGIRCVYSLELPHRLKATEVKAPPEKFVIERGRGRIPLGSLVTLTGMFGLIAAHEAIRAILAHE